MKQAPTKNNLNRIIPVMLYYRGKFLFREPNEVAKKIALTSYAFLPRRFSSEEDVYFVPLRLKYLSLALRRSEHEIM